MMSPLKLVRPTIAPDVTVDAVSANANWKRKNARNATCVSKSPPYVYVSGAPCRKKYEWPMKPFPKPNWKAEPTAQERRPEGRGEKTHSMITFTDSRERATPASRAMKPACMKNTRKAVTSTQ